MLGPALIATLIGLLAFLLRRRPVAGLYAVVALLPLERIGSVDVRVAGHEVTVRPAQVIGAALILLAVPAWRRLRPRGLEWLPALYLAAGVLSLGNAASPARGVLVVAFSSFVWLLFIALRRLAAEIDVAVLDRVIWISTLIVTLFALYQFLGDMAGLPVEATGLRPSYTSVVFGFPRVQAFALEPLYLANLLLWPLGLFVARLTEGHDGRVRLAVYLSAWVLTLTLSRGGFAAGVLLLGVVLILSRRTRPYDALGTVFAGVLSGLALIVATGGFDLLLRFLQQAGTFASMDSVVDRAALRAEAFAAFQASPWLGIGIGNFGAWAHARDASRFSPSAIANNEPLELLAETGICGFLAIAAFVVLLLVRSHRAYGPATDDARPGLVGLTAALLGTLLQYQTFSTLYITWIWVYLGLLAAVQDRALARASTSAARSDTR